MTERKPPGVSFESWADRQIREAEERGAFDGLTGKGKPLPSANAPYDDLWWVKRKMRSEGLSFLPPSLALRKEAEDAVAAIASAGSERQVRQIAEEINGKIAAALRRPPEGPPLNLVPLDVERTVADWHARRAEAEATAADADEDGAGLVPGSGWYPYEGRGAPDPVPAARVRALPCDRTTIG